MKKRKVIEEQFFKYLLGFFTYSLILILFFIVYEIAKKGIPALSWEMITQVPEGGVYCGKEGGIYHAILGALYLPLGPALMPIAVSLPVDLLMNIPPVSHEKILPAARLVLVLLGGVPP